MRPTGNSPTPFVGKTTHTTGRHRDATTLLQKDDVWKVMQPRACSYAAGWKTMTRARFENCCKQKPDVQSGRVALALRSFLFERRKIREHVFHCLRDNNVEKTVENCKGSSTSQLWECGGIQQTRTSALRATISVGRHAVVRQVENPSQLIALLLDCFVITCGESATTAEKKGREPRREPNSRIL